MICACLQLAHIYALAEHVRVYLEKLGWVGTGCTHSHIQATPTFTKSMSTTINSVIATTFKQLLPVCICNSQAGVKFHEFK